MAGAPIPDDWDGSTYQCYRVQWPSSIKWEAILLGQISEPAKEAYYDENTGDRAIAAVAADNGFRATSSDFWTLECDELVGAQQDVPMFRVGQPDVIDITDGVWTNLEFLSYIEQRNSPEFDFIEDGHRPIAASNMGLWHYRVQGVRGANVAWRVRLRIKEVGLDLAMFWNRGHSVGVSRTFYHSIPGGVTVVAEFRDSDTGNISSLPAETFFEGFKIGD